MSSYAGGGILLLDCYLLLHLFECFHPTLCNLPTSAGGFFFYICRETFFITGNAIRERVETDGLLWRGGGFRIFSDRHIIQVEHDEEIISCKTCSSFSESSLRAPILITFNIPKTLFIARPPHYQTTLHAKVAPTSVI